MGKKYEINYDEVNYPYITKLAFEKCEKLKLSEFEKWVLFDFDTDSWADHLESILESTKEELSQMVLEKEIADLEGKIITEKDWENNIKG